MIIEVFFIFLRLGLTSFGGPVAHLGYFRQEFVEKRKWLDSETYSDLVALCQFLPGPSSSQVGMAIGVMRAGVGGSIAAWLGFTLPSAVVLIVLGLGITQIDIGSYLGLIHGLKMVAAAVVAQAIWGMAKSHCSDFKRGIICVFSAIFVLLLPGSLEQITVILISGVIGAFFLRSQVATNTKHIHVNIRKKTGLLFLALFGLLLIALPAVADKTGIYGYELFARFFQTGSLVFGGGHVVLPLLQSQVVPTGWVSNDTFLAGYGLTQAVPGPLFTFAAYLGAVSKESPSGWLGGLIAITAIFLPSFLMVIGIMPFWEQLRESKTTQRILIGVNAAVVGLLIAAFYNPIWVNTVFTIKDLIFVLFFYLILQIWKLPPWLVVIIGALIGMTL